jgi:dTDP-glucose pyrophosphorylase
MKGVILAGGTGSRLDPLTRITNKALLPIYDRPMVTYSIESLVRAGVSDVMLVTGGDHAGEFLRLSSSPTTSSSGRSAHRSSDSHDKHTARASCSRR